MFCCLFSSTEWDAKSVSFEEKLSDLESQLMHANVESLDHQQQIRELQETNETFKQENLR